MCAITASKIYYQNSGYPIHRNIVGLPFNKYKPEKKIGLLKVFNHLHYKLKGSNPLLNNSHWELLNVKDGIWHLYNGISFSRAPWVVTFETKLPRWGIHNNKMLRRGVKMLARPSCRKLIAHSNCGKKIQTRYLLENYPSLAKAIIPKITMVHPSQQQLVQSYEEKNLPDDRLIFTLIGADFFRKGGREVLLVFDELLKQGAPVELQIISRMKYGDYASRATERDLHKARSIIKDHPHRIHHFNSLPNSQVLEVLKKSHIGLLPTYGDTFGYSVLEAQGCGCPVITTNIRAMPEINNNRWVWVIEVPKDRWGNGWLYTPAEREEFSYVIRENLYKIIDDIIANPLQIAEKGNRSLKHIAENHNPEDAVRQLEHIYDEALGIKEPVAVTI
jgi:glycosyltransferase involved in cell wall biosynthesis